jgi:hypothetical protein
MQQAAAQVRRRRRPRPSATGVGYSGYRFWGEVSSWPPRWDTSGTDVYVPIQAAGITRRLNHDAAVGSALRRFYGLITGQTAPAAYRPCEEATAATQFSNVINPANAMTISGTPDLASDTTFPGSDPVPLVSESTRTGNVVASVGGSGDDVYTTPGTYTWVAPAGVTSVDARVYGGGGGGSGGEHTAGGGASGGGGGGFAEGTTVAVTPGNSYTVIVGAAGSGGEAGKHDGTPGGDSSFEGDDRTAVIATGGRGGFYRGSNADGGLSGTGLTGNDVRAGGDGGSNLNHGTSGHTGGGGGGGAAGSGTAGNPGGSPDSSGNPGAGGAGGGAGGAGGDGGHFNVAGHAGTAPGGGGGGGWGNSTDGSTKGGNGAAGKVELVYTPVYTPGGGAPLPA